MGFSCNKNFAILIVLALGATLGVIFLFVGCALQFENPEVIKSNWWGLFVFIFYLISPIPLALARCCVIKEAAQPESLNLLSEICYFISACIVVSAFGLPFVLARGKVIEYGAAGIIGGANIFVFSTVYSFVVYFIKEEEWEW